MAMEQPQKDQLLHDLKADLAETQHRAALKLSKIGNHDGFKYLQSVILNPPRANSPENDFFEEALSGVSKYLTQFSEQLSNNELRTLTRLEDVDKDIIYYLEDDPLYDVGHDFIHADYAGIRELAGIEFDRRIAE